jgi:hypothetical protein
MLPRGDDVGAAGVTFDMIGGLKMMMPGVRWVCEECSKVTFTAIGVVEADCEHCGHHMDMAIVTDCYATLLKSRHHRYPWSKSFWELVLFRDSDPVELKLLSLAAARNLVLGHA